jgi:hypothetical protein
MPPPMPPGRPPAIPSTKPRRAVTGIGMYAIVIAATTAIGIGTAETTGTGTAIAAMGRAIPTNTAAMGEALRIIPVAARTVATIRAYI